MNSRAFKALFAFCEGCLLLRASASLSQNAGDHFVFEMIDGGEFPGWVACFPRKPAFPSSGSSGRLQLGRLRPYRSSSAIRLTDFLVSRGCRFCLTATSPFRRMRLARGWRHRTRFYQGALKGPIAQAVAFLRHGHSARALVERPPWT